MNRVYFSAGWRLLFSSEVYELIFFLNLLIGYFYNGSIYWTAEAGYWAFSKPPHLHKGLMAVFLRIDI